MACSSVIENNRDNPEKILLSMPLPIQTLRSSICFAGRTESFHRLGSAGSMSDTLETPVPSEKLLHVGPQRWLVGGSY